MINSCLWKTRFHNKNSIKLHKNPPIQNFRSLLLIALRQEDFLKQKYLDILVKEKVLMKTMTVSWK